MTGSLPVAPSLEQLRKQAEDLLRAHRAGVAAAAARVAAHHPRPSEPLKLADVQLVIARASTGSPRGRLCAGTSRR